MVVIQDHKFLYKMQIEFFFIPCEQQISRLYTGALSGMIKSVTLKIVNISFPCIMKCEVQDGGRENSLGNQA